MARHWWWPFGGEKHEKEKEADEQFRAMLAEARLRQDDLKQAADELKKQREKRRERKTPRAPSSPELGTT